MSSRIRSSLFELKRIFSLAPRFCYPKLYSTRSIKMNDISTKAVERKWWKEAVVYQVWTLQTLPHGTSILSIYRSILPHF